MKYIILIAVVFLQACDVGMANRSGTLDDDYVEEPLSSRSKEYESALRTSNKVMSMIRDGHCDSIYQKLFLSEAKKEINFDSFMSMCKGIYSNFGALKKYKPDQWHFFKTSNGNKEFLMSIKIAEHENLLLNYALIFPAGGNYEKIVGIYLKERQGTLPPGVF